MNSYYQELKNRRKHLIQCMMIARNQILKGETRMIKATQSFGNFRYYLSCGGNYEYLDKSDLGVARGIIQSDYARKYIDKASAELKIIERLLSYEGCDCDKTYDNLSAPRKELASPIAEYSADNISAWLKDRSSITNSHPKYGDYFTLTGEQVRSKSELIIADRLTYYSIPYKYEEKIELDMIPVFPDFTILTKDNREVYWEHFGMIDDGSYVNDMAKKMNLYTRNGIILGKNLIMSFESRESPLSMTTVNRIINDYLL